jgi:hypothetical protein
MFELALKSAVAAGGAAALRRLRIVRPFPGLSWGAVKLWAPVAVLYCARLILARTLTGADSLPSSVLVYGIMNPVVVVTSVGEYYCFGSRPERLAVAAFATMLGGAVLAASQDGLGQTMLSGLPWLGLHWLFSSGIVLYLKFATDHINVSIVGMVFVNSVLCAAIALPAAILNGEASSFLRAGHLHTFDYFSSLFFVGVALFFQTCAVLNCFAATGPTTYTVLSSVVSVATSLAFHGGRTSWIYSTATLLGGVLYSCAKLRTSIAAGDAGWAGEAVRSRFAPLSQDDPEAEPLSVQLSDQSPC